uniref:LysM domain-containing protein n=1 Tax=Pyricularia oryzae (strain P131) TaxID=1143193 RepID=L7JBY8_PYRO1
MSYNSGYGNQQGGANSSYYNSGGPQNQGQNPYGGPPPLNGQQQGGPPPSYNHGPGFNQGGNHGPPHHGGPGGVGQDGERGILGAMGGGAAGGFAGHKMGHGILGAIGGAVAGHFAEEKVKDWRDDKKEEEERRKREEEDRRRREDDDKRRREEDDRRRHDNNNNNNNRGCSPPRGNYAGNFSGSSRDICLDGARLRAECRRGDGGYSTSVIDLNRYLSNDNGHFRWVSGGGGGGGTATVTVQQGDTLRDIGRRFDCDFHEIARRNNIQNEDLIYPGQVLQVPTKGGSGGGAGNFWDSARDVRLVDGGKVLEAELRYSGGWNRSRIYLDEHIGNRNGELIHC